MEEGRVAAAACRQRGRICLLHGNPALPARAPIEPKGSVGAATSSPRVFLGERSEIQLGGENPMQAPKHLGVVILVNVDRGAAGIEAVLGRDDALADDFALPALKSRALETALPSGESACDAGPFVHGGEYTRHRPPLPPGLGAGRGPRVSRYSPLSCPGPAGLARASGR